MRLRQPVLNVKWPKWDDRWLMVWSPVWVSVNGMIGLGAEYARQQNVRSPVGRIPKCWVWV